MRFVRIKSCGCACEKALIAPVEIAAVDRISFVFFKHKYYKFAASLLEPNTVKYLLTIEINEADRFCSWWSLTDALRHQLT